MNRFLFIQLFMAVMLCSISITVQAQNIVGYEPGVGSHVEVTSLVTIIFDEDIKFGTGEISSHWSGTEDGTYQNAGAINVTTPETGNNWLEKAVITGNKLTIYYGGTAPGGVLFGNFFYSLRIDDGAIRTVDSDEYFGGISDDSWYHGCSTATSYTLTVNNGFGSGEYLEGQDANINADPSQGTFTSWSGATVASESSASTTLTMGTSPATVTANYGGGADYGTIAVKAATYSITEGETTVSVLVSRTGGTDGAVSVDYATADLTATAGDDYTAITATTLDWAAGNADDKTIEITIADDSETESAETFELNLSNVQTATLGTSQAIITINDNDVANVSNMESNEIIIYPNPNNGIIYIKNNNSQLMDIKIYDIKGKIIFTDKIQESDKIDITNFEKGTYLIKIFDGLNEKTSKKIILQ